MEKEKKPIYKKLCFWIFLIFMIFIFIPGFIEGVKDGISNSTNIIETQTVLKNEQTDNTSINTYSTKLEWTNNGTEDYIQSIKIAVEKENYEGDNLESGNYLIEQTNTTFDERTERIYNIFVSNIEYNDINDVPITDYIGLIGGMGNDNSIEINVEKGQFIYLQTNSNGTNGHLKITKK